jgi:hypothetical protein
VGVVVVVPDTEALPAVVAEVVLRVLLQLIFRCSLSQETRSQ